MKDTELNRILKIPIGTIQEWKNSDTYRKTIYDLLISMDKEELKQKVEAIKLLKGL